MTANDPLCGMDNDRAAFASDKLFSLGHPVRLRVALYGAEHPNFTARSCADDLGLDIHTTSHALLDLKARGIFQQPRHGRAYVCTAPNLLAAIKTGAGKLAG